MIRLDLDVSLAETGSSPRYVDLRGPKRHGSATLWRGVDATWGVVVPDMGNELAMT